MFNASYRTFQAALNKVMHRDTQQLPSEMSPDVEMVEVVKGVPVITFSSSSEVAHAPRNTMTPMTDHTENVRPGTSNVKNSITARIITFHIRYLDQIYKIDISESCTLSKFKNANVIIMHKSKLVIIENKYFLHVL